MNIKLNKNLIITNLIIFYPVINILLCYALKGDGMVTISLSYTIILLILITLNKNKIRKKNIYLLFYLLFIAIITIFRENNISNISISFSFIATIYMFYIIINDEDFIKSFSLNFENKKKTFYFAETIFLVILGCYIFKYGLTAGWSTYVLQGPYNYPHTLAYLLLFMMCGNIYLTLDKIDITSIILTAILAILIILTSVRSAILSEAILFLFVGYLFMSNKTIKKILLYLLVAIIGFVICYKMGYFDSVLAKTNLSISNGGGLSNGRKNIFLNSLKTFENSKGNICTNLLFGCGLKNLLKNNQILLGYAIHAHNDFIDAFVCYGVISFGIYSILLIKCCTKYCKNIFMLVFLAVLAFYNGLYVYIDCIPLLVIVAMAFSKKETKHNL